MMWLIISWKFSGIPAAHGHCCKDPDAEAAVATNWTCAAATPATTPAGAATVLAAAVLPLWTVEFTSRLNLRL